MRLTTIVAPAIALLVANSARADTFAAGSLIIPMDTEYQDLGVFEAYGLVYELLRSGVPVRWVIKSGKALGDADFTVAAVDVRSMTPVPAHGYRGGPWVIDAADAVDAMPIVETWLAENPSTNVHEASADFDGDVSRLLVVAPTIAMMADGNQKIARKYMMAAKIPDSTLDPLWPDSSPDMLDPLELAGPSADNHHDGALFDEDGDPVYCQFMSMHWGVGDAEKNPGAVAEVRDFLTHPTHLFAECQAVNAFENLDPHGYFLTKTGFLIGDGPKAYDHFHSDEPFNQFDGDFVSVGGSEPAYSLPPGETYKADDIVFITEMGTPVGVNDVWMTGFLDGLCPGYAPWDEMPALAARPATDGAPVPADFWLGDRGGYDLACLTNGKVSYLGGHEYSVDVPISENADAQGARLFLNSLFEAPCATAEGLPTFVLDKSAPAVTDMPEVTFTIDYQNEGPIAVLDAVLKDTLPAGSTYVASTPEATVEGDVITWSLGNLGVGEGGQVSLTVELGDFGSYDNVATLEYHVGLNLLSQPSNKTTTLYGVDEPTGSGPGTAGETEGETASGTGGSESATGGSGSATGNASESDGTTATTDDTTGGASAGSATAGASGSGGEPIDGGCGCRSEPSGAAGGLLILLLAGARRRRASAR